MGLGPVVVALAACHAHAVPDLRGAEVVAGVPVWPDHRIAGRYYHGLGRIELADDAAGRPRLDLLSTRYVGTAAAGTQGQTRQFNRLSFTVVMTPHGPVELEALRAELRPRHSAAIDLRPLPVLRMPTRLVYQPIGDPAAVPTELPRPSLSADQERTDIWNERSYELRISAEEAQVLQDVLQRGGVRFSLSYGLVVNGLGGDLPMYELRGSPELVAEVRAALDQLGEPDDEAQPRPLLAVADATSITVDLQRWPGIVSQIDINERLPPGFGVLEVRCYDFQSLAGVDLFEVRVDIRAETVIGDPLVESVIFSSLDPERFASRVRFPVAVRLDRPYDFRVTRVGNDGEEWIAVDWTERESWTSLLDVTRAPVPTEEPTHPAPEESP